MTYQEWADDYLKESQKIKERIAYLKAEKEIVSVEELQELEYRIQSLYDMYLDCLHTYRTLSKRTGVVD